MKIFKLILVISVFFNPNFVRSQNGIQWQKCIGGSFGETLLSFQQTSDGGYIAAGLTRSNDGDVSGNHGGYADAWVVKMSGLGVIEWQKCLGGSSEDQAYSIEQTFDGGFILAGWTASIDGDVVGINGSYDGWVVKLDSLGFIEWQKCLGGSDDDQSYYIKQTSDSGFIVTGRVSSLDGDVIGNHGADDGWVVKLSSLGVIQWQKCLGGSDNDYVYSIQQLSNGGYILAGRTLSVDGDVTSNYGGDDCWVINLSDLGVIQWQNSYGGSGNEVVNSIQPTSDGGYIFVGPTGSNDVDVIGNHGGYYDALVIKLDHLGAIEWQKCFGGSGVEYAYSIQQTSDNGYIIAGSSTSNDGDVSGLHGFYDDVWVIKLSDIGTIQWQKCLGGGSIEFAYSIQVTSDGGYAFVGRTNSFDGDITSNHGGTDGWIVKLYQVIGIDELSTLSNFNVYPMPSDDELNIEYSFSEAADVTLELRNILGETLIRLVFLKNQVGLNFTKLPISNLYNGIYFLNISTKEGSVSKKVIVNH